MVGCAAKCVSCRHSTKRNVPNWCAERNAKQCFRFSDGHSHALDFEIVDYALRNPTFEFVGLIGSQTKRARFLKRLHEAGHDENNLARLTCPIGATTVKSKLPAAIAAGVTVQLLEMNELLSTVIPAEAGIHQKRDDRVIMDSRLGGNDGQGGVGS